MSQTFKKTRRSPKQIWNSTKEQFYWNQIKHKEKKKYFNFSALEKQNSKGHSWKTGKLWSNKFKISSLFMKDGNYLELQQTLQKIKINLIIFTFHILIIYFAPKVLSLHSWKKNKARKNFHIRIRKLHIFRLADLWKKFLNVFTKSIVKKFNLINKHQRLVLNKRPRKMNNTSHYEFQILTKKVFSIQNILAFLYSKNKLCFENLMPPILTSLFQQITAKI